MSELSLLEEVKAELKAAWCTNMRCSLDERLEIWNQTLHLSFEVKWTEDNRQVANCTPKDMVHLARTIEQFVDITIISSPELNTLHDYMRKFQAYKGKQVLNWSFYFRLNGLVECHIKSDLLIAPYVTEETWEVITTTFGTTDKRIIVGKNLEPQLWKFRNSPPVRFLMGVGCVLIKEEWYQGEV